MFKEKKKRKNTKVKFFFQFMARFLLNSFFDQYQHEDTGQENYKPNYLSIINYCK